MSEDETAEWPLAFRGEHRETFGRCGEVEEI